MSQKIESQIAFVTGSNRGIGRSLVEALLERGAPKVYAAARNTETLAPLREKYGDRIVPVSLDVTDTDQISQAAAIAGDVTLLINNAGYLATTDMFVEDLSTARKEFEINYWGPLNLTRAFAPILKENGGGAIINLSSIAGLTNFPALPTYSDSKAAAHSLTSASRLLLAGQGTFVQGVYPGPVDTDMAKDIEMEKATPASVAKIIFDDFEAGNEESFTDAMSETYREAYNAGQKQLERNTAQMLQPAEA